MADLPVACTLGPGALLARREGPLAELLRRAEVHQELADGHRLAFAATTETLALVMKTVEMESRCCRFLRFQITVEPDGGPVTWTSPVLQALANSCPRFSRRERASPILVSGIDR